MVGWKGLLRSLSGKAAKEETPPAAPVHELLDTSWSGKNRQKYFGDSGSREGSRGQAAARLDGSARHHHHRSSRPPRHTAGLMAVQGAGPVAVCSKELAARLENLAQQPSEPTSSGTPSPCGMQRSGSAPQCILSSSKRPVEGGDSASSIHGAVPSQAGGTEGGAAAAAAGEVASVPAAVGQSTAISDGTGPLQSSSQLICHTGSRQQEQTRALRYAPYGHLRSVLCDCAAAAGNGQAATAAGGHQAAQLLAAMALGSLEKPSEAILSTLSRSMPSSRDTSVHGGQGLLARECERGEEGAQQQQQRQQQQGEEGRVASGSGRPVSQPLPCSREGSQHGRRNALGELAMLPPGEPALDRQLQAASMPAGGAEDLVCSPSAVSLLSLQLRGVSAGNSVGASREGSFRPLTRQLSAGGLSVALSREGSSRAGTRNSVVAAANWGSSMARSREVSGRDRSAYFQQQQQGPEGWPQQALPHSREGSGRGAGAEGSARGYLSREGSMVLGSLHPVSEAGPYRTVPLPPLEGGSWTHRITSYPTATGAAATAAASGLDRSGSRPSHSISRRHEAKVKQQTYAVDPLQLTAALSALALSPKQQPSPPAQEAAVGSAANGGSEHGARQSVLVGDPDWATQVGDGTLRGSGLLPEGEFLTACCPSEVLASQQVAQGSGLGRGVTPAAVDGSGESGEGADTVDEAPLGSSAQHSTAQHAEHAEERKDWNRKFIRRWKAVKKRARIQAMGLRSLWKVNSPSDVHLPDELLVDLPQNDLSGRRFWHSPPKHCPGGAAAPTSSASLPTARRMGSRAHIHRDPSLATMLLGEVAEVT